jgi:hypothetical protein
VPKEPTVQIKNVNGFTIVSTNDWKVNVPTTSISQVVSALQFASQQPQEVVAEKQRRGRKLSAVKPATKAEAVEAAVAATSDEAPKKRGRKPLSAEQKAANAAATSDRPKMADVLKTLSSRGKVTRDQLGQELVGLGYPKGATAAYIATLDRGGKFGKDGVYAEPS